MGKKERAKCLKLRDEAIRVIRNIRKTRRALAGKPLDDKLYDAIQGKDHGVENLLGRDIMFKSLNETERRDLRKELLNKLEASEKVAFEALRQQTCAYLKSVMDVINSQDDVGSTNKTLVDLGFTNSTAVEAFNASMLEENSFDHERCQSTLEHLEKIAQAIEAAVPTFVRFLDEAEEVQKNEEDEHQHDLPEEEESYSDDNEAAECGEGGPAETNEEDEDDEETDEENSEGTSEDEPSELDDITFFTAEVAFVKAATPFIGKEKKTLSDRQFKPANAIDLLKLRPLNTLHYKNALKKFCDVLDPENCVDENLLRGNVKFFRTYDKVVSLVNRIEPLRRAVNTSCKGLVAASHEMLLKATRDPML